jgi:type II secretory pathway component GspD/PulD (secretin)
MLRFFGLFFVIFFLFIHFHLSYAQHTRPLREPMVIKVIRLDHADAEELANVLAPLLSKEGRVVPYPPTNTLIIRDRASLVNELVKIIKGPLAP